MDKLKTIDLQLEKCSKCGTCRAHCPVFKVLKEEPYVARGKVRLARSYLKGEITFSRRLAEVFEHCLLCKTCSAACPNGVEVDAVVMAVRAAVVRERGLPLWKRIAFRRILLDNRKLTILSRMLRLGRKLGMAKVFPSRLSRPERLLPLPAAVPFRATNRTVYSPSSTPRGRVAYFTGCMTHLFFPQVGRAVVKVLNSFGFEVIVPEQFCCGIPALSHGDVETFLELACKNIESLSKEAVDYIVTDCASCTSTWRLYSQWVEGEAAAALSARVLDFSSFLIREADDRLQHLASLTGMAEERLTVVTYHDPCHLRKALGVMEPPRRVIKSLPGVRYVEMQEADSCCGAAGSYCFLHYDMAREVGKRKIAAVLAAEPCVLVTQCPSCMMQLKHGLEEARSPVKVQHLAELVAEALPGF
ncbi:MAG: (Fe-S)-binding protein [Thermanaeromonas sp.]|uniref:(Fe-S)-binding protein n=1 Tax=Thermanaeromonas sp. TaxID=2003697 RepID=UPI00243ECA33|nr:(Fe-S)-binding protein [Thermanaeromonas sp.]MCG0278695.1 (Fe-S)-binding protein [Thermanaeromonas sp.]